MNYLKFTNELSGFLFFSRKTGKQIYRFELFWNGYTPVQCFRKFNAVKINKDEK